VVKERLYIHVYLSADTVAADRNGLRESADHCKSLVRYSDAVMYVATRTADETGSGSALQPLQIM